MVNLQISSNLGNMREASLVDQDTLRRAAQGALIEGDEFSDFDLTILLTDDDEMRALNRQFRHVDAPTDVLAFPGGETDPDTESLYLGDVIISLTHARKQADTGGHSLEAELQLLVVHGVLHLLGYDHADERQKAAMWATQSMILARIGCPITTPSEKKPY